MHWHTHTRSHSHFTHYHAHTVTLRLVNATTNMTFRGFFIQGRTQMTNMMVGAFVDPSTDNMNTRLSFCTTPTVGVTHNNPTPRVEFTYLTFYWVAPAAGTGPIWFRYSVVQTQPTWWANDPSGIVQEGEIQCTTYTGILLSLYQVSGSYSEAH
jgi:hypothetical protein